MKASWKILNNLSSDTKNSIGTFRNCQKMNGILTGNTLFSKIGFEKYSKLDLVNTVSIILSRPLNIGIVKYGHNLKFLKLRTCSVNFIIKYQSK